MVAADLSLGRGGGRARDDCLADWPPLTPMVTSY